MSAAQDGSTSVSLLEHLHASLAPLLTLDATSSALRDELKDFVKPEFADSTQEIPYSVLLHTSRWSNTPEAKVALKDASLGMCFDLDFSVHS